MAPKRNPESCLWNDLVIDSRGDIFFTATPAALAAAVYRFRPFTGVVNVIENGLIEPNGIGLPLDERTMCITDPGAFYKDSCSPPGVPLPPLRYNSRTRGRCTGMI